MTITFAPDYVPEIPPETKDARRIMDLHCAAHESMTRRELEQALRLAWLLGYTAGRKDERENPVNE